MRSINPLYVDNLSITLLWYTSGMSEDDPKRAPGPEADRLKIDGDWKDAVGKALDKEKLARPR